MFCPDILCILVQTISMESVLFFPITACFVSPILAEVFQESDQKQNSALDCFKSSVVRGSVIQFSIVLESTTAACPKHSGRGNQERRTKCERKWNFYCALNYANCATMLSLKMASLWLDVLSLHSSRGNQERRKGGTSGSETCAASSYSWRSVENSSYSVLLKFAWSVLNSI